MTRRLRCEQCDNIISRGAKYYRFQQLIQGEQRTIKSKRMCSCCAKKFLSVKERKSIEEEE